MAQAIQLKLYVIFIFLVVSLLPTVLCSCVFVYFMKRFKQKSRINPLVEKRRRPPGYSIRIKLDDLHSKFIAYFAALVLLPIYSIAFLLTEHVFGTGPSLEIGSATIAVICVVGQGILARKMYRVAKESRHMILGLQGELFVGEELNLLMLEGCRVFHDLPIEFGNIDHIVVTTRGVFAVDTKMRGKPDGMGVNHKMLVDYTSGFIRFPDVTYPLSIYQGQLANQKRCLEAILDLTFEERIRVKTVLAFPGWYIERKGYGDFAVINPKNHALFLSGPEIFTELQVKQIAKRLDELCRDVEPVLKKRKKERWEDRRSA